MSKTTVVNIKHDFDFDVYIGRKPHRPYHWGNPFHIGSDGTRKEVIQKFDYWLSGVAYADIEPRRREWILENLGELRGERLG